MNIRDVSKGDVAVRAHDIAVCMENKIVSEFDHLHLLGMAVRLALHLRGVPARKYEVIRDMSVYLLEIPIHAVERVLYLLAEAEFVRLDTVGRTIRTVIPEVPYYELLFVNLGEVSEPSSFTEQEQLAVIMLDRLSNSPILKSHAYNMVGERPLIDRVLSIGNEASFISEYKARGKEVLISPTYFSENTNAYTDLVAGSGTNRVAKMINLLKANQGWPLAKIILDKEICGVKLDDADLAVARALAGAGFISPPAITTTHAGTNHFLFGPRPGESRLPAFKRHIYESAMALVAAVRQGQLIPETFRIRDPFALLSALRDRGFISSNSEALQQYREVVVRGVGTLEQVQGGQYRFVLSRRPENIEAVTLAIAMVSREEMPVTINEDLSIALKQGDTYVESLIGRKRLLEQEAIEMDPESLETFDDFLLRGRE